jgi:hypothetical protein
MVISSQAAGQGEEMPRVGAFTAYHWLPATSANFPGHEDAPGRRGFVGSEALAELRHRGTCM